MAVGAIEIGRRVRALRAGRLMTQKALADAAKVSRVSVTEIENGRHCKVQTLQRLADALGIDIADLLGSVAPRLPEMPHWP